MTADSVVGGVTYRRNGFGEWCAVSPDSGELHNAWQESDCLDEIERLRAAIDAFVAEVDGDHQPEWASEQAKESGKKPWCCEWCGTQDGGWPCCHRMALDGLKEARRG